MSFNDRKVFRLNVEFMISTESEFDEETSYFQL